MSTASTSISLREVCVGSREIPVCFWGIDDEEAFARFEEDFPVDLGSIVPAAGFSTAMLACRALRAAIALMGAAIGVVSKTV